MDAVKPEQKAQATGRFAHRENVGLTIEGGEFKLPEVDMDKAASIRPSKVSGKNVMWLVTFVAGMGVSNACDVAHGSSQCSVTTRAC
jgi:hypothetical protein